MLQFVSAVVGTMMALSVLLIVIRELMEKEEVSKLTTVMLLLFVTDAILSLIKVLL